MTELNGHPVPPADMRWAMPGNGNAASRRVEMVSITAQSGEGLSCTLRFDDVTGMVVVSSDYIDGRCWLLPWERTESLGHVLAQMGEVELAEGLLGTAAQTFDYAATLKGIRNRAEAEGDGRELKLVQDLENDVITLDAWAVESKWGSEHETFKTRLNPHWRNLWREVWAPIIRPILKQWPANKAEAVRYERQFELAGEAK